MREMFLSPYLKQEDALYNSIESFRKSVVENHQSFSGTAQAIRIQKILEKADREAVRD